MNLRKRAHSKSRLGLTLLCAALPAMAQLKATPYDYAGYLSSLEFQLPWDGPGAAVFNPAMLSETGRLDLRTGIQTPFSGRGGKPYTQIAARLFQGTYAGFGYYVNRSPINGSNAVYYEDELHPMLAYGFKNIAGSGFNLGMGAAFPMRHFNAFGAVESTVKGFDLGFHLETPADFFHGGYHLGFTLLDMFSSDVMLPQDKGGGYEVQSMNSDLSLLWISPGEFLQAFADLNMHGEADPAEGPDPKRGSRTILFRTEIKDYGVEVRPIPHLGVKLERVWNGYITLGLTTQTRIAGTYHLGAEADIAHDAIAGPGIGPGLQGSFALNAGF